MDNELLEALKEYNAALKELNDALKGLNKQLESTSIAVKEAVIRKII